jgi:signal transduction histidine kinase
VSRRPALAVLGLAAVILALVAGVLRLSGIGGSSPSPESMQLLLIAAAALCVVGLSFRRHPTAAWLALVAALTTVTFDLAGFGRSVRADLSADAWQWLALLIALAAIATTCAAVAFATEPTRRLGRWVAAAGLIAVAVVFAVAVWSIATPDAEGPAARTSSLGDLGSVTRAFLVAVLGFVSLGVLGEIRPAVVRARRRVDMEATRPVGARETAAYASRWTRILVDELRPGGARARQAAHAERTRLARDLHAVVVPDLRRAIRDAEAGESVERFAGSLRDALRHVEALMEAGDLAGLEAGGLVPALESLAERVEDRSDVRVTIDVADDGHGAAGPPMQVAGAALRVAALALDNVIRHAPSARVRLLVASAPDRVRMTIEDDGPGASPEALHAARIQGRRGLADMVTEASMCGASVRSARGEAGVGMVVAFDWPAS